MRVVFTAIVADGAQGIEAVAANTYKQIIENSKSELLALINRERAVIDLLRMSQGDRSAMEFVGVTEDQARLCRGDVEPIKEEDLIRMALIGGMKDRGLAEKALAEKYNFRSRRWGSSLPGLRTQDPPLSPPST